MKITHNCEYCGSGIFESDRNCVKCGAPISSHKKKEEPLVINYTSSIKGDPKNPLMYTYHHGQNGDELKFVEPVLIDSERNNFYKKAWDDFAEVFCK